jgi:hypothetical protein
MKKFPLSTPLRHVGRVVLWRLSLLASGLHATELSTSRCGRFTLRKETFYRMGIGGWVGHTAGLVISLVPTGIHTSKRPPVAVSCTDCEIPAAHVFRMRLLWQRLV